MRAWFRPARVAALLVAVLMMVEIYWLFVDQDGTFAISGRVKYDVPEFAEGKTVSQAFMMVGGGLESVMVRLGATAPAPIRLRWTLWRGYVDYPPVTPAATGEESLTLRPGHQWVTLNFVRDGSSHDRWYTLDLQLIEPLAVSEGVPRVSVTASQDNPDRGGVLFVNAVRQPGSLEIRANRHGRTLYRRFVAEVEPNLPIVLRWPVVQWTVMLVLHAAFIRFAFAVVRQGIADTDSKGLEVRSS